MYNKIKCMRWWRRWAMFMFMHNVSSLIFIIYFSPSISPCSAHSLPLFIFLFYFIATCSAFIHIWWCWISRFTISSIIHLMSDEWMAGITTLWWRWLLNIRTRNISFMAFNFLFYFTKKKFVFRNCRFMEIRMLH